MYLSIIARRWLFTAILSGALACSCDGQTAQEPPPKGLVKEAGVLATLRAEIEAFQAIQSLDEEDKLEIRGIYDQAIAEFERAEELDGRSTAYRESLENDRERAEAIRKEMSVKPMSPAGTIGGEVGELLEKGKISLARQGTALAELEKSVLALREEPAVTRENLASVRLAVEASRKGLEGTQNPAADDWRGRAKLALLRAQHAAAMNEAAMLEEEELSHPVRLALREAERDLAAWKLKVVEEEVKRLQARLDEQLSEDVRRVTSAAQKAETASDGKSPVVQTLASDLAQASREYERVVDRIQKVDAEIGSINGMQEELRSTSERIRSQFEFGGLEGAFAQILLDQYRRLPNPRVFERELVQTRDELSSIRLAAFQVDEQRQGEGSVDEEVAQMLEDEAGGKEKVAPQSSLSEDLVNLVSSRSEVRTKLSSEYRRLIEGLGKLDFSRRQYLKALATFRDFLGEKLFWVRTSSPVSIETFKALPAALSWLAGPPRWREIQHHFLDGARTNPIRSILLLVTLMSLILLRSRMKNRLTEFRRQILRASTDRFSHTLRALVVTIFLALPAPLALGFVSLSVSGVEGGSEWLSGCGRGLGWSAILTFVFLFLISLCRKNGLGPTHFSWPESRAKLLSSDLKKLALVYVPSVLITTMTVYGSSTDHLQTLGRLVFVMAMVWTAVVLRGTIHPQTGVFSAFLARHPSGWLARLRYVWYWGLVLEPLVLAMLALSGFLLTALQLNFLFQNTVIVVAGGALVYILLLRWLAVRQRKLNLETRLKERRERLAVDESSPTVADEIASIDAEQTELDLETVGDQTRRLLRFLVGASVVLVLWFVWAGMLPAVRAMDAEPFVGDASMADLLLAAILGVATVVTARNLPGLLEVAVLRNLPFDSGSRFAIATLAQYATLLIGLVSVINVLHVDGSSLGWIAAALGVGLGFGLQEIVANFVCGIILLFERPIRVGDIITVDDVTGVVSRIRIRATTITNWDRKEFIVPNKEFITGKLLNWTLSSSINRIVISVGVAYGTDTDKVQEILYDIVRAHPEIVDDPAPIAVFEKFGDSTLDFSLRCYLSKIDKRLQTTTEVNSEIHRRFAAAGIEIAFPQRDLHLRSVDAGVPWKTSVGDEGPKN